MSQVLYTHFSLSAPTVSNWQQNKIWIYIYIYIYIRRGLQNSEINQNKFNKKKLLYINKQRIYFTLKKKTHTQTNFTKTIK